MKKAFVNFKELKVFTDITHEFSTLQDVRKDFSDMIYKNLNGVVAHDVALRIYHSDGVVELNEEECQLIVDFSKNMTPIFQDSLLANIEYKEVE